MAYMKIGELFLMTRLSWSTNYMLRIGLDTAHIIKCHFYPYKKV